MKSLIDNSRYGIGILDKPGKIGFWVTVGLTFLVISCLTANANPVIDGTKIIAAGEGHTAVVKRNGTVWAWGSGSHGQLGAEFHNASVPVQVYGLTGAVSVSAGTSHTVALKADGTVWAWGYNGLGQLCNGTSKTTWVLAKAQLLSGVVAVSAGKGHTVALKSDGTVWACGWNDAGELGDGTMISRSIPVQVSSLNDVVAVSAGQGVTMALKADGTVWAWGSNFYGALGDGIRSAGGKRPIPAQVSGLAGVVAVSVGNHAVAVKADGTVWTWGVNNEGQLGDGTKTFRTSPVQVSGLAGVISAFAGRASSRSTVALKSDGTVWAWGNNDAGQLGDGTLTPSSYPVQVSGLTGVVSIDVGREHTIALKSDGTLWTWGANNSSQLGDDTQAMRIEPVQVVGISDVVIPKPPDTKVTATLTASPATVNYQGSTTLNWSSSNANYCSATTSYGWSGEVALSGNVSIAPNATTTITLSCTGNAGSSSQSVTVTVNSSPDCLFNWAEANYPGLFSPAGAGSLYSSPYTYRYYKDTNSYVGVSSSNNHVYYLGPDNALLDVGGLPGWLTTAGCQ